MDILKVKTKSNPRLDSFIIDNMPTLTLGKLNKYLRENKIKLNGKKQPLSTRLNYDDEVKLFLPIVSTEHQFETAKSELDVVYEDDALLIVQKPAGLLCEDAKGIQPDTLQNRALRYLFEKGAFAPDSDGFTPCLCHRLDVGTSGLVMLAKTEEADSKVQALIKNHKIKKEYLCVTFGIPQAPTGTLRGYLIKDAAEGHVQVREAECKGGKEIVTQYRTLATSGRLALLNVTLVTGRTHQIRAHLASIGCPILGDSKYGNNAMNRAYRLKYQALCAYTLQFPKLDETVLAGVSQQSFSAEKPWYFEQIISKTLK
ncbi:MAG: RluA family pseudouridine synthase [Oscillospiraceae bacterium]